MGAPRRYYYSEEDVKIAEENGIPRGTLVQRLARGTPIEVARTKPTRNRTEYAPELLEIAEKHGISKQTLQDRKRAGWDDISASTLPPNKGQKYTPHIPTKAPQRGNTDELDDGHMPDWECIAVVARIKYMNMTETKKNPITVPKRLRKRIEAMNMTMDDILPMEVEDYG